MRACEHGPDGLCDCLCRRPRATCRDYRRSKPAAKAHATRSDVLQSADRLPALEISRRAGVSRPAVWRWQRHYAEEEAVERLLRYGSRKPGKAPVGVATAAKVLALTNADPPDETTQWRRGRAKAARPRPAAARARALPAIGARY